MRGSFLLHLADRLIGIPLVRFLGIFKKRRPIQSLPKDARIAVLNTAAIGDTILISAVIADLRLSFPQAEIYFFCGPSNHEAAMLIPKIQVINLPIMKPYRSIPLIRKKNFDLWVDCGQWARLNAIYSFFAKAKLKIGFKTEGQYRHYIYDQTVDHEMIHELDNYRKLVAMIGVRLKSQPKLDMSWNSNANSDHIILHLYAGGSRSSIKQWPEPHWIELINSLNNQGYSVILTGAKSDRQKCEEIRKSCRNSEKIDVAAGKLSLRETALLLISARGVISIDTGVMHLAAVLGCPTIALHGPTSPNRWGGVGPRTISLVPNHGYVPCLHLGFEKICSNNHCMQAIPVDQVIKAFALYRT